MSWGNDTIRFAFDKCLLVESRGDGMEKGQANQSLFYIVTMPGSLFNVWNIYVVFPLESEHMFSSSSVVSVVFN